MGRKERRRRRTILKAAAYTAGALGAAYLSKKLIGGLMKKGNGEENPDVLEDTAPISGEGGFSDMSEEGIMPQQAGLMGGAPILGMPPIVLIGGAALLFFLFKK